MPCLPSRFVAVVLAFAPLFFQRSWRHAEVLLTGAILAPGKRTVTSLLRIMGLAHERRFVNYHRVLNRVVSQFEIGQRLDFVQPSEVAASFAPVISTGTHRWLGGFAQPLAEPLIRP